MKGGKKGVPIATATSFISDFAPDLISAVTSLHDCNIFDCKNLTAFGHLKLQPLPSGIVAQKRAAPLPSSSFLISPQPRRIRAITPRIRRKEEALLREHGKPRAVDSLECHPLAGRAP